MAAVALDRPGVPAQPALALEGFPRVRICTQLSDRVQRVVRQDSIDELPRLLQEIEKFSADFFSSAGEKKSESSAGARVPEATEVNEEIRQLTLYVKSVIARRMPAQRPDAPLSAQQSVQQEWLSKPIKVGRCNLLCEAPVALICPAYNGSCLSSVGHYDQSEYATSRETLVARLHPVQFFNLPPAVQRAVGDLRGQTLDLHLSIADARDMRASAGGRYNLISHSWAYPDLQQGDERKRFLEMGLFAAIGVSRLDYGADPENKLIGIEALRSLEVYAHPRDDRMCMSPDNAHFGVPADSSFSAFWAVVKCDNRVLVTYHVDVHDDNNPFCAGILAAEKASNLGIYLRDLSQYAEKLIEGPLMELATDFERNSEEAMKRFDALPQEWRNSIYGNIWHLQGRPMGVHGDFGRASFHHFADLPAQYRATPAQRAEAIRRCGNTLLETTYKAPNRALVTAFQELFAPPREVPSLSREQEERRRLVTPIIALFKAGKTEEGLKAFSGLQEREKGAIYGIVWRFQCSPRNVHDRFGELSFAASAELHEAHRCSNRERVGILNLYIYQ